MAEIRIEEKKRGAPWMLLLLLLVAAAAIGWWLWSGRTANDPTIDAPGGAVADSAVVTDSTGATRTP